MRKLEQEKHEKARDYATRLLSSLFEEVYSHTGREVPAEVYDRVSDFVTEMVQAAREEMTPRTW